MLITAGTDGEAVCEAMKKRRRKYTFSCVSSYACRLCGTPAGDFYIAVSGQKFLRIVKGLFSKSPLTVVWGGAPYNTCRCGARGRASHIPTGVRGGAPYLPPGFGAEPHYTSIILRAGRCPALVIFTFPAHRSRQGYALRGLRRCRLLCHQGLCPLQRLP